MGGGGAKPKKIYPQPNKLGEKNLPGHSAKKIPSLEDWPINFTLKK
jgi:hypothetical protein